MKKKKKKESLILVSVLLNQIHEHYYCSKKLHIFTFIVLAHWHSLELKSFIWCQNDSKHVLVLKIDNNYKNFNDNQAVGVNGFI